MLPNANLVTLALYGGYDRRGGIMKSSTANVGDQNHTVCFKGGSRKCSVAATKILRPPFLQAINNDRSLRTTETRSYDRMRLSTPPKPLCFPKSAGRQNLVEVIVV